MDLDDIKEEIEELTADLKQRRDELRVQLHLAGAEAKDALNAFRMLLWQLRDNGWRRMRIPPPGFDTPSHDERAILGLIAAAQAQDQSLLDARLRWLIKRDARRCAETAATVVGMALAMNGNFVLMRTHPRG